MEETIKIIKDTGIKASVVGTVLTEGYAQIKGADFYQKTEYHNKINL